jgi:hypothetical protein
MIQYRKDCQRFLKACEEFFEGLPARDGYSHTITSIDLLVVRLLTGYELLGVPRELLKEAATIGEELKADGKTRLNKSQLTAEKLALESATQ